MEGDTFIDKIRRSRSLKLFLLLGPGLIFLAIFFFAPFVISLMLSLGMLDKEVYTWYLTFEVTLRYYIRFFTNPGTVRAIILSFYYASVTTIGTLLLAYPMAYYMAFKMDKRMKTTAVFIIFLPFWINFILRVYAMRFILHEAGPLQQGLISIGLLSEPIPILGTDIAVIITMIYSYLIFMLLPIFGVVEKINKEYIEAAYTLGAPPLKTFLKITLPLSKPGIIAGSLLVFIPALGEFVIPILVGGGRAYTIGRLIYDNFIRISGILGWAMGSAAAMVYIGLILISTYIYFKFVGREITLI